MTEQTTNLLRRAAARLDSLTDVPPTPALGVAWVLGLAPSAAAPLAALLRAEADRLDVEAAPTRQAYRESLPGTDLAQIILGEAS
ncbi:hypothetical protein [Actinoalloteichus sp. GBA129-24]|uniref:hypothetical protein n=1 Tax=Actinoalloteichus sp. GBA129-24 TaxID=1612551 RepID=UPI00095094DC|nr:hypothetical protein [Actinoalloteichus sp. GBA129-24]APU20926.1 hypothetical protein UA75_14580 [Actinoalloteichus sp. GBA129-24]APU24175.1 hypothetical protein UA75_31060 [Actinoalloteichus sp. GBA129-24]